MSEMELSLKLRAEGGKKIAIQVGNLGKHFKGLSSEINKTNQTAGKIQNLLNLNKQFSVNANSIKKSKTELANLKKQILTTKGSTKELIATFRKKEKQLKTLIYAQSQEKSKLKELRNALQKTGVNTKNLTKENDKYTRSVERASGKLAEFARKQKNIQDNKARRLQNSANLGFVGAGMYASGRTITRAINSPVKKIKEVEKSKGELQSIMSADGAQKIVNQGRETSKKIAGITTAIFTGAAYTIKSSMSKLSDEAVADMTTAAAITAKATKSDLATMTNLYSKGSGVFKDNLFKEMTDSKFGDMFGSAIAATVQNFDTTGMLLASAIKSAGSSASLQGISMAEQLAVLGALQKTMSAESAGTGYMALTRDPARAQERLNKDGYDVNLLDKNNNIKSMPALIESLRSVFGDKLDAIESGALSAAFGDEGKKVILNLWNSAGVVKKETENIKRQSSNGIEFAQNMMNNMQDNFSDKMDIQSQRWRAIQEQLGEALIPIFESLMPHLESLSIWISDFIKDNKSVAGVIAAAVAGIGGFLMLGGGVVIAMASLTGAAASASAALSTFALRATMAGGGGIGGMGGIGGKVKGVSKLGKFIKGSGYVAGALSAVSLVDTWTDDKKNTRQKLDDTTQVAGGLGGMYGGALAGAAIGSAVPLIGTAIGGLIGGALGYWGGSELGDVVGDLWLDKSKTEKEKYESESINPNTPKKIQQTTTITAPITVQAAANPQQAAEQIRAHLQKLQTDNQFDEDEL